MYRGYELEEKTLMVGWQVTITKDGKFVRNSAVAQQLTAALDEARAFVDGVLAAADAASPGALS
jgi:hypothetical protein